MALFDPELENTIITRLMRHIAGFDLVQQLPSLNPEIASATPSGQSEEQGLVLAVDSRGGTSEPTTTGSGPGRGNDRIQIYVVLSASRWLPERAQPGATESAQQVRDRVAGEVRTASGALLALLGTITMDPALPGDEPGYQGLWYNARIGIPGLAGWVHYDAEGQFRQAQLGVTLYLQMARRG